MGLFQDRPPSRTFHTWVKFTIIGVKGSSWISNGIFCFASSNLGHTLNCDITLLYWNNDTLNTGMHFNNCEA